MARDGRPVLRELALEIGEGSTAVLGPSGVGKSTLLRLLNRLADPDQGRVLFRGQDVRELDVLELRRRAALVPQVPAPLPGTVADNVRFGPQLAGREADVGRALSLAELAPDYAERDAARLSVGEQQRVMLARAVALEPEVLLLDEPTSALDPDARAGVERALLDLRERVRISTVLVTHDRAQAERLAATIVELRDGRARALSAA
ncbi:MAG TPA: ATP-binding cassette domain-containing protein [Thermoleophilaceae bacterium]|nr:ATP-binding cassette domain-containing protein [Thermoleophilaceae bacterium]